mgnify:CR=1 FL=1
MVVGFAMTVGARRVVVGAPHPEVEQAKEAAYRAYEVSDYDTAILEYKKAYRLTNDARLFYNLGLSHRKRFQLKRARADAVEARDYFHRFVELFDASDPKHAAELERLAQMKALAKSYISEMEKELATTDAPRPDRPPPVVHRDELAQPGTRRWGKLLVIAAGALAVTGATTGVLALELQGDANDAHAIGDVDRVRSKGDSADRFALGTDVLLGAAIVSGALGLYFMRSRKRATLSVSPTGAVMSVRY